MLHSTAHELLHRSVHSRQMHEQFLKGLARNSDGIERRDGTNRRIAWLVGNESGFAENIATTKLRNANTLAFDSRLSLDDKVNLIAKIAVRENGLSPLKMLAVHRLIVKQPKLRDVPRQEDVKNPVGNQAKLTIKTWKLRDINAAPQQPGEEPLETKAENFRDCRAPAKRSEFTESGETKVLSLARCDRTRRYFRHRSWPGAGRAVRLEARYFRRLA